MTDVNVIHLSDHGMTEVNISRIINISQIIDLSDCEYLPTSNTIFIIPHPGNFNFKNHIYLHSYFYLYLSN